MRPRSLAQSVSEQPLFDTILDLRLLPWSGADVVSAHVRRSPRVTPTFLRAHVCVLAPQPLYGRDLLLVSAGERPSGATVHAVALVLTLRSLSLGPPVRARLGVALAGVSLWTGLRAASSFPPSTARSPQRPSCRPPATWRSRCLGSSQTAAPRCIGPAGASRFATRRPSRRQR